MKAKDFMTPLRRCSEAGEQRLHGLATASGISVSEETSMFTCIYYLLKHPIDQLPVLDKDRKVVGVLQGLDVFSSVILIVVVGVLALFLCMMRGAIVLPDPWNFIW